MTWPISALVMMLIDEGPNGILAVAMSVLSMRTTFGRRVVAVGSNERCRRKKITHKFWVTTRPIRSPGNGSLKFQ